MHTHFPVAKLRLSDEKPLLLLNSPFSVTDYPDSFQLVTTPDNALRFNQALIFIRNRQQAEQYVSQCLPLLAYDALFWIVYPKGTSPLHEDINRDSLWEFMIPTGLRPVTQVAIDSDWSALRFRPQAEVKSKQ